MKAYFCFHPKQRNVWYEGFVRKNCWERKIFVIDTKFVAFWGRYGLQKDLFITTCRKKFHTKLQYYAIYLSTLFWNKTSYWLLLALSILSKILNQKRCFNMSWTGNVINNQRPNRIRYVPKRHIKKQGKKTTRKKRKRNKRKIKQTRIIFQLRGSINQVEHLTWVKRLSWVGYFLYWVYMEKYPTCNSNFSLQLRCVTVFKNLCYFHCSFKFLLSFQFWIPN